MASQRARNTARQLKVDLKNSMRISPRPKERTTHDTPTTNTSSGRILYYSIMLTKLAFLFQHAC